MDDFPDFVRDGSTPPPYEDEPLGLFKDLPIPLIAQKGKQYFLKRPRKGQTGDFSALDSTIRKRDMIKLQRAFIVQIQVRVKQLQAQLKQQRQDMEVLQFEILRFLEEDISDDSELTSSEEEDD